LTTSFTKITKEGDETNSKQQQESTLSDDWVARISGKSLHEIRETNGAKDISLFIYFGLEEGNIHIKHDKSQKGKVMKIY